MSQIVYFIARKLHRIACVATRGTDYLSLRQELILDSPEHLMVRDVLTTHVVAVVIQQVANLIVQPVLDRQVFLDDLGDEFGTGRWIRGLERSRAETVNQLP